MAEFFNQKEEVLKLELTKHGRKMLGLGIFQPEFYEFFDDSIIYDSAYCSATEEQNDIQERILNKSLTFKSLKLDIEDLERPLGTSGMFTDYAPAWKISILNGGINRVAESSSYWQNIFNVEPDITYSLSLKEKNVSNVPNFNLSTLELEDGKLISIQDDYLLIDLQELNVSDEYENFEIEVETFDDLSGGKDGGLSRKLMFMPKQDNIIDGIIYSEDELPSKYKDTTLTKKDVQYYLDILVDAEIDRNILAAATQAATAKTVTDQVKATYTSTFEGAVKEDC
jgi:hypothetical protein